MQLYFFKFLIFRKFFMQIEKVGKPLLRGHFHQAMFFIFLGASLMLISISSNYKLELIVYSLCAMVMFGISSLYHRIYWSLKVRALWKKLDHAGIYLMIAGTFTPVATAGLSDASAKNLLIAVWLVALVGIIQSLIFVRFPKWVSSLIYLAAGYMILPYFSELKNNIGNVNITLVILGGLFYSIGAVVYGLKRPHFNPKFFGYHEFFHIFVNLGATFHFMAISRIVLGYI